MQKFVLRRRGWTWYGLGMSLPVAPRIPFLHHEVHYVMPNYKGHAVVRAESVEEAERVFRAEMPFLAEAKIIKVIVPRVHFI